MAFDLERDALRLDLGPLLESQEAGRPEAIRAVLDAMSDAAHDGGDAFFTAMAQDHLNVAMAGEYLRCNREPLYLTMFAAGLAGQCREVYWLPEDVPAVIAPMASRLVPEAMSAPVQAGVAAAADKMLFHVVGLARRQGRAA